MTVAPPGRLGKTPISRDGQILHTTRGVLTLAYTSLTSIAGTASDLSEDTVRSSGGQ